MLLQSYVVHSLSRKVPFAGGDEEIRTLDPLLAGQVLSQLSYTPELFFIRSFYSVPFRALKIEQRLRLVLTYSSLSLGYRTSLPSRSHFSIERR